MTVRTGTDMGAPGALGVGTVARPGNNEGNLGTSGTISTAPRARLGVYHNPSLRSFMEIIDVTQNVAQVIPVFMRGFDSALGATGLAAALVFQIRKPGSAFTTVTPAVTERGNGWYDVAFTAPMFDTLGLMPARITANTGPGQPGVVENDEIVFNVTAINKYDGVRAGLTALPNATAGSLGGLPTNAIRTNTAQGGGNGVNQIVLDAGASSLDGFYSRDMITITSGTGAGQSRFIASYVGSTRTATTNKNWNTAPDNTSVFEIVGSSNSLLTEGLAQGGSASTITFRANDSTQDDLYKDQWVHVTSGTGAGQTRLITGYVGSTKVATVDKNWKINPDATSVYQILTGADVSASSGVAAAILDAARSGHLTPGTVGEGIALATSLLQGNFYIDNVDNSSPNGPTAQRLRCFVSAAAMAGVTYGGTGQGEFATFAVTTTYDGVNKIHDHKVVQQ